MDIIEMINQTLGELKTDIREVKSDVKEVNEKVTVLELSV